MEGITSSEALYVSHEKFIQSHVQQILQRCLDVTFTPPLKQPHISSVSLCFLLQFFSKRLNNILSVASTSSHRALIYEAEFPHFDPSGAEIKIKAAKVTGKHRV